jgi:ABC-type antimicrobial peptide transport system permease subunit
MRVCLGAAVWGLGIGALLGWFGLRFAPPDLLVEKVVPWSLLIGMGVGSIVLGAAVSWLPARRAANLSPIRAATQ